MSHPESKHDQLVGVDVELFLAGSAKLCPAHPQGKVVQRGSSSSLYAAGQRVAVDYTRQRPPTMMAHIYPPRPLHSRVGPLGLSRDPYVQSLKHMNKRAHSSDKAVSDL